MNVFKIYDDDDDDDELRKLSALLTRIDGQVFKDPNIVNISKYNLNCSQRTWRLHLEGHPN